MMIKFTKADKRCQRPTRIMKFGALSVGRSFLFSKSKTCGISM